MIYSGAHTLAMMFNITRLQGTARVINYAGLVRGATQREIKLEISQNPNDDLITYLDDILSDLKIARTIRWLEILSAIDMIGLIGTIIEQTILALKFSQLNKQLEQKACIVFDMNNLKRVNDSLGHSIGDQLCTRLGFIL